MNFNALLSYVSEVKQGRWDQFKAALSVLQHNGNDDVTAGTVARRFSALGHAEFMWEHQQIWTICPPTVVSLSMHRQITGIVCGQRTPLLTETLESLTSRYDAKIVAESQPEGPDVIRINIVSLDALQELTEEANMAFAPHIVEHLAMCIPSLEAWIASIPPVPCPAVPPIEYFDPSQRVWTSVDKVVADGLYRYEHFYPDYRLIHNGTCRKVSRELGIYRVLRERLWRYDTETHQLLIPVHLLPPPLYQRALVLCSGFLAQFDTKERYWLYRDVPPAVAYTLAEKLNQSLE